MADLAQVEAAFLKADAAGDVEAARALAGEVRRLRKASTPAAPAAEQPPEPWWKTAAKAVEETVGGISEPIAQLVTGVIAKPIGEIAGVDKGLYDAGRRVLGLGQHGPNAEEARAAVQKALTYEPRTEAGKSEYNPLNAIPAGVGAAIGMLQPDAVTGEESTTLGGSGRNALREAIPQALGVLGVKYGPKAARATGEAARRGAVGLMVRAIDPTLKQELAGQAQFAAQELLKRKLSPNTKGVQTVMKGIEDANARVAAELEGSRAAVPKQAAIDSLTPVSERFMYRPNMEGNQTSIANVGQEIAAHPRFPGETIPVGEAQKLKLGYQRAARPAYGEEATAAQEAYKNVARALRKEIESAHPSVKGWNAEASDLHRVLNVIDRSAAQNAKGPIAPYVGTIGGLPYHVALAFNRSAKLKSGLAHGLQKVGETLAPEVIPPLRRIQINKDIPFKGLPNLPGTVVTPGSWREGVGRDVGGGPLPAMSEDLLPHGAGGALRTPDASGPLPELPPIDPLGLPPVLNAPPIAPVTTADALAFRTMARRSLPVPEVELQKLGIKADNVVDAQHIIQTRIQKIKTGYERWAEEAAKRFRAEQAGRINERANNPPVLSGAERRSAKQMRGANQREMDLARRTKQAEMQAQIDALESMSERLSSPRSGTLPDIGQGPKTRQRIADTILERRK